MQSRVIKVKLYVLTNFSLQVEKLVKWFESTTIK